MSPRSPSQHRCRACPRLAALRTELRRGQPDWHNAPVEPWGPSGGLLIVGLAPGRSGANRTGRPFDGDPSGALVQDALRRCGALVEGRLLGVRIVNAVACLPPHNRPLAAEIRTCGDLWLQQEVDAHRVVLALGRVAHDAVLARVGLRPKAFRFAHGARHSLQQAMLFDSFHPSPLNTRTGRLSVAAFEGVVAAAVQASREGDPLTGRSGG